MVKGRSFLTALLTLSLVALARVQADTRILGGAEASLSDYNYVASVRLDAFHACGGSIIGPQYILTTAKCVIQNGETIAARRLSVRVGSTNQLAAGQLVEVASIHVHPDHDGNKNNLAVLQLERSLTWSDKIASVSIATTSAQIPVTDAAVNVAGWGRQSTSAMPYRLHATQLTVANSVACVTAYSAYDANTDLCLAHALKVGSCTGDSGNGAVYNGRLVGVSNFVVGDCGSRYPDVFVNILPYVTWINGIISA